MIVARGNQKSGAGKTTFALHLEGQTARQSKRITLFDAEQQGSALVSLEQHGGKRQERLFAVIGLAQAALHREAPEHALLANHIIINGSPLVAALRSVALAAALAPVPTQPALLDSRASTAVSGRGAETRVFRSTRFAHVSLRRWPTGSLIARGAPQSTVDDDPRFRFSLTHGLPSPKRRGSGSSSSAKQRRDGFAARETAPLASRSKRVLRDEVEARRRLRRASARCRGRSRRSPQPRAGASQPGSPWTTRRRSAAASRPQPSSAARPPHAWPV